MYSGELEWNCNKKIVPINNDSLYEIDDNLADLLTQPFEIEPLSDSQFQKTVKDLQSSPVEIHRSPLSNLTNTSSVESVQFRRMPVMPTSDKMMNRIPHFAENCVVNIHFNYKWTIDTYQFFVKKMCSINVTVISVAPLRCQLLFCVLLNFKNVFFF
jgi:hypothetical protein